MLLKIVKFIDKISILSNTERDWHPKDGKCEILLFLAGFMMKLQKYLKS